MVVWLSRWFPAHPAPRNDNCTPGLSFWGSRGVKEAGEAGDVGNGRGGRGAGEAATTN